MKNHLKPSTLLVVTLIAVLLSGGAILHVRAQGAEEDLDAPRRVLVAPVAVEPDLEADPLVTALPALLVEAVSADGRFTAALSHQLSADALEALSLSPGAEAAAETLSDESAAPALRDRASVRILLLPEIKRRGSGEGTEASYQVTVRWHDLVRDKDRSASARGEGPEGFVDAVGEAVREACGDWSSEWNPSGRSGRARGDGPSRLSTITSASPAALASWGGALVAWATGAVPRAESLLAEAIDADAAFDLAKVDLAWIRLGQGRNQEAVDLATAAMGGTRLSPVARARAEMIVAAGGRDAAMLNGLAERLGAELPGVPWGPLAGALAHNLGGTCERAVSLLDEVRLHRPRDPAVLHQAGIAALCAMDEYESVVRLREAVDLWPEHDRIQMDLAEAHVRARNLAEARASLEAWAGRFRPQEGPIWGGDWSYEDPPPPVRLVSMDLLAGALTKGIEKLEASLSALESAGAPPDVRFAVLMAVHRRQMELAWGETLWKHRWLGAARESFLALKSLMSPEDQKARPWVLDHLEAHIRVRENRTPEAAEIRERILAAADLPGYDPGIEAEIEAAIALKEADRETLYAACQRAVEVRGLLSDHLRLGQAYMINREWEKVEAQFQILEERLTHWAPDRRHDAILWSPEVTGRVPFIYTMGAHSGVWRGDADAAKGRFGVFLSYFQSPDEIFHPYVREARDRGAKPAW